MSDAEFARFFQKSLEGQDPMEMTFSSFDLGPGGDKDLYAGMTDYAERLLTLR